PTEIISFGSFTVSKTMLLLLLFAVLMIIASYSMIKKGKPAAAALARKQPYNYPLILVEGTLVGILTGLVGAGGGFLIIPALVLWSNLPMKEAVGTSLVIIAAKSLLGFFGESSESHIDWPFLFQVTAFAIAGIFIG